MSVTIKLSKLLTGHKGPVAQLVFREPLFPDFCKLGEPESIMWQNGIAMVQVHTAVIGQYAEVLLSGDGDPALLDMVGLKDTLKIRDAILGFFRAAGENETSTAALPTNSSSSSDGVQEAST